MTDAPASTPVSDRPEVFLKPGGDRRLAGGHPWVFANEVRMDEAAKAVAPGSIVTLRRVDGKPLGQGSFNPHALICFRLWDEDATPAIDGDWFARRLRRALRLREALHARPFYRLVHGEADGLPGLVVDRFGEVAVVQTATAAMDAWLDALGGLLEAEAGARAVVVRNDGPFRRLESLAEKASVLSGETDGRVIVEESGLAFRTDVLRGQKTGWFFDQRDNRAFVASLARGRRVLDVYSYAGALAVQAAVQGAESVLAVDRSEPALDLARASADDNGAGDICTFEKGDAFESLDSLAADGERFGVVAADPPAFVKSKKDLKPGLRGYRKLARAAARLVGPEGFLFLASCSHNVPAADFEREVATGIRRAGRTGRIIRTAGAAPDHPVHPHLPESRYLKALVLQLD